MNPFNSVRRWAKDRLKAYQESREKEHLLIGQEYKTLVQLRIQTSGKDSNNEDFAPYTLSYAAQREERGRQTGYVDFTDTGRMWANIHPEVEINGTRIRTTIKAKTEADQIKIDGAFKKRGNILKATEEEEAILRELHGRRNLRYLQV